VTLSSWLTGCHVGYRWLASDTCYTKRWSFRDGEKPFNVDSWTSGARLRVLVYLSLEENCGKRRGYRLFRVIEGIIVWRLKWQMLSWHLLSVMNAGHSSHTQTLIWAHTSLHEFLPFLIVFLQRCSPRCLLPCLEAPWGGFLLSRLRLVLDVCSSNLTRPTWNSLFAF